MSRLDSTGGSRETVTYAVNSLSLTVLLVLIVSIGAFIRRKRQRKEEEQSKAKEEEQKQIRELYGKGNGADSIEYNFSRHHKPKWDAVEAGVSTSDFDEYEVPEDPSLPRPRNSTSRLAEPRSSTSRPSSSLLRTPVSPVVHVLGW